MTHDAPPPIIPGLEIIDVIAHGGQATLYRADQFGHDRTVAVKVPHARLADEAAVRRFDRERTALGRLSAHPDIVALLDSGYTEDDCPYLVLEYAPGGTLADRLASGPMSVDEATDLAVRMAGAFDRDLGFIDDFVDAVSIAPAAADDSNDGLGRDAADGDGPNRGGRRDGNRPPEAGRPDPGP